MSVGSPILAQLAVPGAGIQNCRQIKARTWERPGRNVTYALHDRWGEDQR
ncbi:MAG: hypothetical protein RLY77_2006 [Pseudomonadota bacterium]|jgi:hypothetical protein